jgi:hypothetical protein
MKSLDQNTTAGWGQIVDGQSTFSQKACRLLYRLPMVGSRNGRRGSSLCLPGIILDATKTCQPGTPKKCL